MNANNNLTTARNYEGQSNIVFGFRPENHREVITNINNTAENNLMVNKVKTIDNAVVRFDMDGGKDYRNIETGSMVLKSPKRKIDEDQKSHLSTVKRRKNKSRRNKENDESETMKQLFINDKKIIRYYEIHNANYGSRGRQPFLYDVKLDISFNGQQLKYMTIVIKSALDIIMGAIIHSDHSWRIATRAIIMDLLVQITNAYINANIPSYRWKTAVHACGYCPGNEEQPYIDEPLSTVQKSLGYSGHLKPSQSEYVSNPEDFTLTLEYVIKYSLSPVGNHSPVFHKRKSFRVNTWLPRQGRKFAFENFNFITNKNYDHNKMYNDSLKLAFIEEQKTFNE
ncbi:hypothetical protein PV327_010277 [Microctonus hyperodae]|uniref:Uncharacterized protein n=1 Tax=Microctonus hyperodae TaxID=165561 RepID=A0AA39FRK0_MICHY|nr:hypothetical protein PV327_010277 [Microctonus hyperodae]